MTAFQYRSCGFVCESTVPILNNSQAGEQTLADRSGNSHLMISADFASATPSATWPKHLSRNWEKGSCNPQRRFFA
jgi:hypothetical protein